MTLLALPDWACVMYITLQPKGVITKSRIHGGKRGNLTALSISHRHVLASHQARKTRTVLIIHDFISQV